MTSAQTRTTTQSFFDDLGRAVQANPIPAALIGMGALWMLMGGGRTTAAAALLSGGASRVADTLAPAASAVSSGVSRLADGVSDLAASAKDGVSEFASGARDVAGQAFDAAGEAAADGAKALTSTAAQAGAQLSRQAGSAGQSATAFAETIQGNLAQTFERQPLLVGVVGLAIGAAIAGAFRKTRFEEEMIGDQAAALKDKVETLVSEQAENLTGVANRAVDAVKQEAEAQGLTPSALKEGVAAIGKKAATAAKAVRRNGGQQGLG